MRHAGCRRLAMTVTGETPRHGEVWKVMARGLNPAFDIIVQDFMESLDALFLLGQKATGIAA